MPYLLNKGDMVAVTAASGSCDPVRLAKGVKVLEDMGLRVRVMPSCHAQHGTYLAGTDELRLRDLHAAFADCEIKGIFMARGGYGAARLLPYLDYKMIYNNPKVFVGFSDVTALHIVLNQVCKMVTFHGPMVASCLPDACEATLESLKKHVFEGNRRPQVSLADFDLRRGDLWSPALDAPFAGGNLTVVASTIGTPWEINTRGRILFLEEIQEEPYRVDRLLLQLKLAGKFRDAEGIAFGSFHPETLETLQIAINELVLTEGKPVVWGLQSGHPMPNLTLPFGVAGTFSGFN